MNTLKVFTAFSGYDSQCMALDRLGIDYSLVGWSEINKYAIQAHNAVYPQYADRNYGDISKIDWNNVPDFDLFTYSFPCQDISRAGLQRGLKEGSGTRSGLLWECRKTIEIKRPKYLLMENVKALTSDKFMPYLRKWLSFLESMGYSNFTKVLNSKDYGVPQNRERVFVVSILGDERYYFPKPFKLEKRLKDIFERKLDKSYFLSKKIIDTYIRRTEEAKSKGNGFAFILRTGDDIAAVVKTRAGSQIEDNFIIEPLNADNDGLCRTIKSQYYKSSLSNFLRKGSMAATGVIDTCGIRKLTPRECFRLMGVSEHNIDKIMSAGISKTQLYKLAGNSIVVDVLYYIFKKMFIDKKANIGEEQILFG